MSVDSFLFILYSSDISNVVQNQLSSYVDDRCTTHLVVISPQTTTVSADDFSNRHHSVNISWCPTNGILFNNLNIK